MTFGENQSPNILGKGLKKSDNLKNVHGCHGLPRAGWSSLSNGLIEFTTNSRETNLTCVVDASLQLKPQIKDIFKCCI